MLPSYLRGAEQELQRKLREIGPSEAIQRFLNKYGRLKTRYSYVLRLALYFRWLRAQRASCLIAFYGMSMEEMMEWLGWEHLGTARVYARFGEKTLAAKLAGKAYPPPPALVA